MTEEQWDALTDFLVAAILHGVREAKDAKLFYVPDANEFERRARVAFGLPPTAPKRPR